MNDLIDTHDSKEMIGYINKGFVKSERDKEGLHMSFSPYQVPRGLTSLQIRRRINGYFNGKKTKENGRALDILTSNRLEMFINGKFILGSSFRGPIPKDSKGLKKLLKDIVKTFEGRKVKDCEDFL